MRATVVKLSVAFLFAILVVSFQNCSDSGFMIVDMPSETVNEDVLSINDGRTLYASKCASCHGSIDASTKKNASASRISIAIQSVNSMANLRGLSDKQINSIALALAPAPITVTPTIAQFQCETGKRSLATVSPLKRLTTIQYKNTIRSLFSQAYDTNGNTLYNDAEDILSIFPQDALSKSGTVFDSSYSSALMKAQFSLSNFISTQASSTVAKATSVGLASSCFTTPSATCIKSFISSFGRKLLRRKLTPTDTDNFYSTYYSQGATNAEKLKGLMMGLMLDPEHLMLFELGNDVAINNEIQLTPYEVASRLSYMIVNDTPDEALLTAAENANLSTEAGIQTQIDRLIQSNKFTDNINNFLQYWLQVNPKSGYPSDLPAVYFNDTILGDGNRKLQNSDELKKDAADFFVGILKNQMTYKDLMTAPLAFPTSATAAKVYGLNTLAANGNSSTVAHRGLIQRPAFLLNTNGNSNPIYRGKFVLTQVLCRSIGSPADFGSISAAPNLDPVFYNTRQVIESKTAGAACIGCHSQFNHLGFALENYDGLGRYRTSENYFVSTSIFNYRSSCNPNNTAVAGYNDPHSDNYCPPRKPPYNHTLNLNVSPPLDVSRAPASVGGAIDFAEAIANSSAASACMAMNIYRYTNLQMESSENNCELSEIEANAQNNSMSLKNVMFDRFKQTRFKSRKVIQ